AASSVLAGILGEKYIGGPDMRMGEEEMVWVETAAREMGRVRPEGTRAQLHPAVTGLPAESGGFPPPAGERAGRNGRASLEAALLEAGVGRYGVGGGGPVRVLIQGFGDVGGSVARLLTEESPGFDFRLVGVADEFGALYREAGLDVAALLRLRAARRSVVEYD